MIFKIKITKTIHKSGFCGIITIYIYDKEVNEMKKRLPFIVATVLATLFIFNNSLQTAEVSSSGSGVIVKFLENIFSWFKIYIDADTITLFVRKSAHIAEFTLQSILLANCFEMQYKRRVIYILFFGLLTACTDEYIQLFSSGRASMVGDIFIDFLGTVIGTLIAGISYKFRRK